MKDALSHFPKIAFHSVRWALRLRPCFVVGIPVAFAILRFALVIPNARFQLNPPKAILITPY
jgi:hypothetical protein